MKTCPIWAALIASVVLLQTVSPVSAKIVNQQFSTIQYKFDPSGSIELSPNTKGIADLQIEKEDSIQPVNLEEFAADVTTGEADRITGLYVPDFGGFYVIQQTSGNDGSVSPVEGVLTQYLRPTASGVIGLLAHNFASGKWFDRFPIGSLLYVLFGDGRQEIYRLTTEERYQAVDGNSPYSDFIELTTGETLSANQVYQKMYSGKPHLTLQTCIQQEDDKDWGRLFLLAEPIE